VTYEGAEDQAGASEVPRRRDRTVQRVEPAWRPTARQVIAIIILVLILVFALVNLEKATIDLVFDQVTMPIFFVIAFPALAGFVAGLIVQRHRDKARRS
jgi:uncharacterized integral membrane protein